MTGRMQELLGLLSIVVERIRAANERTERAESRASQMGLLLDALSDENVALRVDLEQAEAAAAEAQATIRGLRDQVEAGARIIEMLESRAAEAEFRIHRAADALGLPAPLDPSAPGEDAERSPAALH